MTRRRLLHPVAVAAALWVVLAGCGGGGVEPRAWAADVCGSVDQYQQSVQKAASKLPADSKDPAEMKKGVVTLLGSTEHAIQGLQTDVEDAGVPDTENGEASRQEFLDGLQAAEKAYAKAREDVQAASATDRNALLKVLAQVGQDVTASQQKFGKVQDDLSSPELKKAFKKVPACKRLGA